MTAYVEDGRGSGRRAAGTLTYVRRQTWGRAQSFNTGRHQGALPRAKTPLCYIMLDGSEGKGCGGVHVRVRTRNLAASAI